MSRVATDLADPAPRLAAAPSRTNHSHRFSPLVAVSIAFALGISIDRFALPLLTLAWSVLGAAAGLLAVGLGQHPRLSWSLLLLGGLAWGGARHHAAYWDVSATDLARTLDESGRPAWVRGVLVSVPEYRVSPGGWGDADGYTQAELALTAIHDRGVWRPVGGRAILTITGDRSDLAAGQPIRAAGSMGRVRGPINPGEPDPRPPLRYRRILSRLAVDDPAGVHLDPDSPPWPWKRFVGAIRVRSQQALLNHLDPSVAPLATALLLGRRGAVAPEIIDAFAHTGTTHLLAISGLHLHVLAASFYFFGKLLGWSVRPRLILAMLLVVGYATLVGWMPSVARATVMAAAVGVAHLIHRSIRPGNLLGLAALATLVLQPGDLFHPGWQLSFAAVAALLWGVEPFRLAIRSAGSRKSPATRALDALQRHYAPRWHRAVHGGVGFVQRVVLSSIVVSLVTAPLTLWWFHILSPIGIALNVILIPLTSAALLLAGLVLLLSWAGLVAALPAWLCGLCLNLTSRLVLWGESLSAGHLYLPPPPTAVVLLAYLCLGALVYARRPPEKVLARAAAALVAGLGVVLLLTPRRPDFTEADVLAVGHGLAVVVQTPEGRVFLYDCGRSRDPEVGRKIIAPALWARGVRTIDAVFLSHADLDHLDGLPDLLDRFRIRAVYGSPALLTTRDPASLAVLERVRQRGIPLHPLRQGDRLRLSDRLEAHVLHPPIDWPPDAPDNDGSLVVELVGPGNPRVLLTGDVDGSGLTCLTSRRPQAPYDAVLSPHHGGRTANPAWFYDWASTPLVLVSQQALRAGTSDPLEPIESSGRRVLRTWETGSIRLVWHPSAFHAVGYSMVRQAGATHQTRHLTLRPIHSGASVASGRGGLGLLLATVVGLLVGAALLASIIAVEWGAWALVSPRPGPVEPLGDPWETLEATTPDGFCLRAWYRAASSDSPRLLVLVHGLGETSQALRSRADFALDLGWNVLMPDARAFGRSDGTFASFGARESADLSLWLDTLLAHREGQKPTVLWGRSMGAAIALGTAASDRRVSGLILEAPYADLLEAVSLRLRRYPLPGLHWLAPLLLARAARLAGVSLHRPAPIDLAPRGSCPVLLLHGALDQIVPARSADRLAAAFSQAQSVTLLEVPQANHTDVFDHCPPSICRTISRFLASSATAV